MNSTILQRIAQGDQRAVAECVHHYGPRVWSITRRFSATGADAEDATQDVFLAIWQAAGRFDPSKAEEATFVSMIARRRMIDRLRQQPDAEFVDTVDELPGVDASAAEGCAEVEAVAQALRTLESPQREVLLLSVYAGHSHAAIAEQLNLPLGTVKTHLRRGMQKIRDHLGIIVNPPPARPGL